MGLDADRLEVPKALGDGCLLLGVGSLQAVAEPEFCGRVFHIKNFAMQIYWAIRP